MMTMQISIHGRLGRVPKQIQTQSGTPMAVASIAVAIPHSRGDEVATEWFNLVTFGKLAETLLRHQQGEMMNVMGTVQINQWTDQEGQQHRQWQIIADSLISARTTRPNGGKKKANSQQPPPSNHPQNTNQTAIDLGFDDEVPF